MGPANETVDDQTPLVRALIGLTVVTTALLLTAAGAPAPPVRQPLTMQPRTESSFDECGPHTAGSSSQAGLLRPGGVNVMTSGAAIAHAERTPTKNSGHLNGAQLWVALPERHRHMSALFQHVERVPLDEQRGGIVQVFAGSLSALASPATDRGLDSRSHNQQLSCHL